MADRFVRGYVASEAKLAALVGAGNLTATALRKGGGDALEDVEATLEDDEQSLDDLVAQISSGDLDGDEVVARGYFRVLELVLGRMGTRLPGEIEVMETYYLPNESFGRWTPVLEALGVPVLARCWARANVAFPWNDGEARADFPVWTAIGGADRAAIADELARVKATGKSLAKLTADAGAMFSADAEEASGQRDELARGLRTLAKWIAAAGEPVKKARPLVGPGDADIALYLLMDGDQ